MSIIFIICFAFLPILVGFIDQGLSLHSDYVYFLLNRILLSIFSAIIVSLWISITDFTFAKKWNIISLAPLKKLGFSLVQRRNKVFYESIYNGFPIKVSCVIAGKNGINNKKLIQMEALAEYNPNLQTTFSLSENDSMVVRNNETIIQFFRKIEIASIDELYSIVSEFDNLMSNYTLDLKKCNLSSPTS